MDQTNNLTGELWKTQDDEPDGSTNDGLIFLVEQQRDLIAAVATGTRIRGDLDAQYKERRRKIQSQLSLRGLDNPFRWPDLKTWWAYCGAPRMTTYAERRLYVAEITESLLLALERRGRPLTDWGTTNQGVSWPDLEARLDGLKSEFDRAGSLDEFQDTARRAREVLIDAANLAFDESMVPVGADRPRRGDALSRFELILAAQIPGASGARLRQLLCAAWRLAQKVTHSRGAGRVDAFAVAQATILVVRTLQEMTEPRR